MLVFARREECSAIEPASMCLVDVQNWPLEVFRVTSGRNRRVEKRFRIKGVNIF